MDYKNWNTRNRFFILRRENLCLVACWRSWSLLLNMEQGWFCHFNSVEETISVWWHSQSYSRQASLLRREGYRCVAISFHTETEWYGMWNDSGTGQREMGDFRHPTNFDVQQIHVATHRSRENKNKIYNKTWKCNADHPHKILLHGERVEWSRLPYLVALYAVVLSGFLFKIEYEVHAGTNQHGSTDKNVWMVAMEA